MHEQDLGLGTAQFWATWRNAVSLATCQITIWVLLFEHCGEMLCTLLHVSPRFEYCFLSIVGKCCVPCCMSVQDLSTVFWALWGSAMFLSTWSVQDLSSFLSIVGKCYVPFCMSVQDLSTVFWALWGSAMFLSACQFKIWVLLFECWGQKSAELQQFWIAMSSKLHYCSFQSCWHTI